MVTLGFSPSQFTHPVPFLKEVKTSKPVLVVLDLALGQSDAIDVIRQLETLDYGGRVMLISGCDEAILSETYRIGERHGLCMLPSVKKPFRAIELHAALKALDKPMTLISKARSVDRNTQGFAIKVDLEEALSNKWLELWYQPKVDLKVLTVCGAEALVRVRHPKHGIVPPAGFLPAAGSPLHRVLAKFVIQRALSDWSRLAKYGASLKLSVNMPISVIGTLDFMRHVQMTLPREPFPGLVIEVTEDEIIADTERFHEIATQLRLHKVSMSIDDFGSAYASLARLKDLPFSELKIDRQFVHNCSSNKLQRSLCKMVADLGHRFGATVCAEGIERTADLRALIDMEFDTGQGFLFAKPMPLEEFAKILNPRRGRV